MTNSQIKHMVDRFLSWKLPTDFHPDNGISYERPNYAPNVDATPVGTNLLTATQAEAMVRHMVYGFPYEAAEWSAEEVLDLLTDAIGDSFDMDWQARDGARAIMRELAECGLHITLTPARRDLIANPPSVEA